MIEETLPSVSDKIKLESVLNSFMDDFNKFKYHIL